ncbi:putative mitochondrial 2-oxoglutarate/malate carrier protein [Acrodontium crateriforme]|uniref:Mitochondrial 2-oxoglutarate/malate carrier protein n=1 Tax=Acrodontium crateriforme TaxID=150365 RepID=A0AAQ3M6Y8_9PEZI|nr:putative mitochondrial 2-oxoglutarate/malate carrier protein [Acrodontium crateriforme]
MIPPPSRSREVHGGVRRLNQSSSNPALAGPGCFPADRATKVQPALLVDGQAGELASRTYYLPTDSRLLCCIFHLSVHSLRSTLLSFVEAVRLCSCHWRHSKPDSRIACEIIRWRNRSGSYVCATFAIPSRITSLEKKQLIRSSLTFVVSDLPILNCHELESVNTMSSTVDAAKRQGEAAIAATKEAVAEAPAVVQKAADNPMQASQDFLHTPFMRGALPFINGGLAGMAATTVIQPVDMIKVRLQLAGEGVKTGPKPTPLSVTREIIAAGKVMDLYTGLSAGLLRQAVYTTARLGFFDTFMKNLTARAEQKGEKIGFKERAGAGLAAGGLAAMLGNPADLALIRMQSDGLKPVGERANYRGVGDALMRITKNEGILRLWAGAGPTVVRAMALNFGQLAFFSEAKSRLKDTSLGPRAQTLTASAFAGFFASFFSLPFDFIKTRLQKQSKGPDGKFPYNGFLDCAQKVVREEGLLRFYRGFATYYVRIAPHAMVTLIVADYLNFITK